MPLNPTFLQAVREALRRFPAPFYAYDWTRIAAQVKRLRQAFPGQPRRGYLGARLFYALKANPRLGLLRRLRALGLGAVSLGEVLKVFPCRGSSRAYRAGFGPGQPRRGYLEEVLWNGPVKTEEALGTLREKAPWVVLDSEGDLLRVARLLPGARFRRLARDYERLAETLRAWHGLAYSVLMTAKTVELLRTAS